MDTRKYISENGVMKLNPAFRGQSTVADPKKALAIVSTPQDMMAAGQLQQQKTGVPMQVSEATSASIEIMQDKEYLDKFQSKQRLNGGDLLDGITNFFAKYEVPIGLVNKLLTLSEYNLNFMIDDSGSMGMETDVTVSEAMSQVIKTRLAGQSRRLTRMEEAEDRLHVMIDMLAFIPTGVIHIHFFNREDRIVLRHEGKTPEEFAADAHQKIAHAFRRSPVGNTPIYKMLSEAFSQTGNTMHYLFTDGEPTDASIERVQDLVLNRKQPKMNPLTFMSCTDDEALWMKEIEEKAPFTSELDDFKTERSEVLHDQGPGFPFSKGFWLLCQLVAAINPYDLDALDESTPFTKMTMDNLMGRKLTVEEYGYYFNNNPNARKHSHLFNEFCREDVLAHQIIGPKHSQAAPASSYTSSVSSSSSSNPSSYSSYSSTVTPSSHTSSHRSHSSRRSKTSSSKAQQPSSFFGSLMHNPFSSSKPAYDSRLPAAPSKPAKYNPPPSAPEYESSYEAQEVHAPTYDYEPPSYDGP